MKRRYVLSKNINALFGFGNKNKWVQNLAKNLDPSLSDDDAKKCKIVEKDGLKFLDIQGDVYIVSDDSGVSDVITNQKKNLKKFIDNILKSIRAEFRSDYDHDAIFTELKNYITPVDKEIDGKHYYVIKIK